MPIDSKAQEIATTTATIAAQGFLDTLPAQLSETLPPESLNSLSKDLQAELQAVIQSRLMWSIQAARAELEAQQRQVQKTSERQISEPVPAPQPVLAPTPQPQHKHLLVPAPTPQEPEESRLELSVLRQAMETPPLSSQLALPVTPEPEALKPRKQVR